MGLIVTSTGAVRTIPVTTHGLWAAAALSYRQTRSGRSLKTPIGDPMIECVRAVLVTPDEGLLVEGKELAA
jgi:hypothetical protein